MSVVIGGFVRESDFNKSVRPDVSPTTTFSDEFAQISRTVLYDIVSDRYIEKGDDFLK